MAADTPIKRAFGAFEKLQDKAFGNRFSNLHIGSALYSACMHELPPAQGWWLLASTTQLMLAPLQVFV